MVKLYSYWRSSAAWRVRIALNLKQVPHEIVPVHLVRDGGEQLKPEYRRINPNAVVPALALDDGTILTQSLAIIDYLDERYPEPSLLPGDPVRKARVRAAAQIVACDLHPINNLRVVTHLKTALGHSADEVVDWMRHWMRVGFAAYTQSIDAHGRFSFGDTPTLADLCLVPQLYNARRWGLDLSDFGRLAAIDAACATIPAFAAASPDRQPDAE